MADEELQVKKYKLVPGFAENAIGEKCSPITHIKTVYNGDEPVSDTIQNILNDKTQAPEVIIIDLDYRFARDTLTDNGDGYYSCVYNDERLKSGYIAEFQLRDSANNHNLSGIRWIGCGEVEDGKVTIHAYSDQVSVSQAFHFLGRLVVYTKYEKVDIHPKVEDWKRVADNVYEYIFSTEYATINKLALLKLDKENIMKFLSNKYATTNTIDGSVSVYTDTPVELDGTLIFINFRFDDSDIVVPDKNPTSGGDEYILEKIQKFAIFGELIPTDEDDVVKGSFIDNSWDSAEPVLTYLKSKDILSYTMNTMAGQFNNEDFDNGNAYEFINGKEFKDKELPKQIHTPAGWSRYDQYDTYFIIHNDYINLILLSQFWINEKDIDGSDLENTKRQYYPGTIEVKYSGDINIDPKYIDADYSSIITGRTLHKYSLLVGGGGILPNDKYKQGGKLLDITSSSMQNRDPLWFKMHNYKVGQGNNPEDRNRIDSTIINGDYPYYPLQSSMEELEAAVNAKQGDITIHSYCNLFIINMTYGDPTNLTSYKMINCKNVNYLKIKDEYAYTVQNVPYKPIYTTIHVNGMYFVVDASTTGFLVVILSSPDFIKYTNAKDALKGWTNLPQRGPTNINESILQTRKGDYSIAFELLSDFDLDIPVFAKTHVETEQTYIGHKNGIVLVFDHESMQVKHEFDMRQIISKTTSEYNKYYEIKNIDYWDDESIVISCVDNPYIYCVNKSAGDVVWKYQTDHTEGAHFVTSNRQTIFFTYRNKNNDLRIAEWALKKIEQQQPSVTLPCDMKEIPEHFKFQLFSNAFSAIPENLFREKKFDQLIKYLSIGYGYTVSACIHKGSLITLGFAPKYNGGDYIIKLKVHDLADGNIEKVKRIGYYDNEYEDCIFEKELDSFDESHLNEVKQNVYARLFDSKWEYVYICTPEFINIVHVLEYDDGKSPAVCPTYYNQIKLNNKSIDRFNGELHYRECSGTVECYEYSKTELYVINIYSPASENGYEELSIQKITRDEMGNNTVLAVTKRISESSDTSLHLSLDLADFKLFKHNDKLYLLTINIGYNVSKNSTIILYEVDRSTCDLTYITGLNLEDTQMFKDLTNDTTAQYFFFETTFDHGSEILIDEQNMMAYFILEVISKDKDYKSKEYYGLFRVKLPSLEIEKVSINEKFNLISAVSAEIHETCMALDPSNTHIYLVNHKLSSILKVDVNTLEIEWEYKVDNSYRELPNFSDHLLVSDNYMITYQSINTLNDRNEGFLSCIDILDAYQCIRYATMFKLKANTSGFLKLYDISTGKWYVNGDTIDIGYPELIHHKIELYVISTDEAGNEVSTMTCDRDSISTTVENASILRAGSTSTGVNAIEGLSEGTTKLKLSKIGTSFSMEITVNVHKNKVTLMNPNVTVTVGDFIPTPQLKIDRFDGTSKTYEVGKAGDSDSKHYIASVFNNDECCGSLAIPQYPDSSKIVYSSFHPIYPNSGMDTSFTWCDGWLGTAVHRGDITKRVDIRAFSPTLPYNTSGTITHNFGTMTITIKDLGKLNSIIPATLSLATNQEKVFFIPNKTHLNYNNRNGDIVVTDSEYAPFENNYSGNRFKGYQCLEFSVSEKNGGVEVKVTGKEKGKTSLAFIDLSNDQISTTIMVVTVS